MKWNCVHKNCKVFYKFFTLRKRKEQIVYSSIRSRKLAPCFCSQFIRNSWSKMNIRCDEKRIKFYRQRNNKKSFDISFMSEFDAVQFAKRLFPEKVSCNTSGKSPIATFFKYAAQSNMQPYAKSATSIFLMQHQVNLAWYLCSN